MEIPSPVEFGLDASSAAQIYHATDSLPETDHKLLLQITQRSRPALEILYDRYSANAMGVAFQVLQDREQSEGLILEAYWWLWNNASQVQCDNGDCSVWFYRFVRLMALKQKQGLQ